LRVTTDGLTAKRSTDSRAGCEMSPTFAGPFPDGQPVAGGFGVALTTGVGTDVALAEPLAFFAVTRTRSVLSESTPFSVYFCSFAPLIDEQLPPSVSQRSHW